MNVETLMKKKSEMLAELREHGATAIKAEFKKFFDENPECVGLRWTQYTPHFNDGEACTFSRNEFTVKMKDSTDTSEDEECFEYPYGEAWKSGPRKQALDGARALQKIDEEIFQIAFGDGMRVTAAREGFTVDEYDHD